MNDSGSRGLLKAGGQVLKAPRASSDSSEYLTSPHPKEVLEHRKADDGKSVSKDSGARIVILLGGRLGHKQIGI